MPLRLDIPAGSGSPSLRLYNRRSLKLARKLSSRSESHDGLEKAEEKTAVSSVSISAPRVPMEMLERIVNFFAETALAEAQNPDTTYTRKMAFRNFIQVCTLVSKDFRFLVLRRFFQCLNFTSMKESKALFAYLAQVDAHYGKQGWTAAYSWVRYLKTPAFLLPVTMLELSKLTNLEHISIDFTHSELTLQCASVTNTFETVAIPNIVHSLTSITLTNLPRIDIHLLTLASQSFPGLTSVHASSTECLDVCCPSCYENSLLQTVHSPIPELYPDINALADAFGTSLAPLKKLTHLFLGVFLSHPGLLDEHTEHSIDDSDMSQISLGTIFRCIECDAHRNATKRSELLASLLLARHIESLEYVGWSSCFGMSRLKGRQRDENSLEGVFQYANGADLVVQSPPANYQTIDKEISEKLAPYIRHDLTTALAVHRTSDRIKVTRFL